MPLSRWLRAIFNGPQPKHPEIAKNENVRPSPHNSDLALVTARGRNRVRAVLELPEEVKNILTRMKIYSNLYKNFGFENKEALERFLSALEDGTIQLSQESLATIQALQPRQTEQSYLIFIRTSDGEIYLTESSPSSKGVKGEENAGMGMAPTRFAQNLWEEENSDLRKRGIPKTRSSIDGLECGNVEDFLSNILARGASGIQIANIKLAETLKTLNLCRVFTTEWLSDQVIDLSNNAKPVAFILNASGIQTVQALPILDALSHIGVRIMTNVTRELANHK